MPLLFCRTLLISFSLLCLLSADVQAQESQVPIEVLPTDESQIPGEGPVRRAEWFEHIWKQRRSRWAKQTEKMQNSVVFLGDSITQGWGDELGGCFPGVKVANRGISGDTTRGMLYRLQQDVLSLNPSAVVLLMGTNDIGVGASPKVIAGNFKLIIDGLEKHNPQMPIVLCLIFPSSETKARPKEKIQAVNQLYRDAVKGDSQVTVVDTWTLFANEEGNAKKAEFPDLLHPNQSGYLKWAAALRPIFATLGLMETQPDDFTLEPGFESLFNGHDLTGWGFVPRQEVKEKGKKRKKRNLLAEYDSIRNFDGRTQSDDGRYVAKNGRLIVTTPSEGRKIQQLWTTRQFPQDFVLKLEFRATPNADSGIFIRKPQLQCRDYLLAGPYYHLKHYKPQEWNEVVVTVKGNIAHCTCNGEVLEDALELPETGPIGLEGDRGQMEYRRIRIKLEE